MNIKKDINNKNNQENSFNENNLNHFNDKTYHISDNGQEHENNNIDDNINNSNDDEMNDGFAKLNENVSSLFLTNKIVKKINIVVRHRGFLGFCFLFCCVFSLASFFSYSPLDQSFNVVSSVKVQNYAGKYGAYFADLFLQYFGVSSYLIPFWLGYISSELFSDKKIFIKIRCVFFVMFLLSFAFLLCYLIKYKYYFDYLLGGFVVNDLIFDKIKQNDIKFIMFFTSLFLATFSLMVSVGIISIKKYLIMIEIFIFKIIKFITFGHLNYLHSDINHVKIKHYKKNKMQNAESNFEDVLNNEIPTNDLQEQTQSENDIHQQKKRGYVSKQTKITQNIKKQYNPPKSDGFLSSALNSQVVKTEKNIEYAKKIKDLLLLCLADFGVKGVIKSIQVGPVISLFEFEPEPGIRAARIIGLSDDIARYIKTSSCRIVLIASRGTLGIEIPNIERETVFFKEVIDSNVYKNTKHLLPITFGKNTEGDIVVTDLAKMPHLLIAGTTGSGKSVGVNAIILSLLYSLSPEQCRFIMIDPKMLELSVYDGIPHLLSPVITNPKNAVLALKWILDEMERRYINMAKVGVRNILNYNEKAVENNFEKIPFIVVIVDEMADLMVVSGKAVEISIQRISQMARAAGIHLILATQRPSVDVITGVIKANMPTRVSFQVTSTIDSRTIINSQGAEKLLGMGDMIFLPAGSPMLRMHAPFVSDNEVAKVVEYIKQNNPPGEMINFFESSDSSNNYSSSVGDGSEEQNYRHNQNDNYNNPPKGSIGYINMDNSGNMFDNTEFNKLLGLEANKQKDSEDVVLYKQAIQIVIEEKRTSISYIQRKLRIGFNKAASLVEKMEEDGILSKPDEKGRRIINENYKPS